LHSKKACARRNAKPLCQEFATFFRKAANATFIVVIALNILFDLIAYSMVRAANPFGINFVQLQDVLLMALFIDGCVIVLFFGCFLYEGKIRNRTEENLNSSLKSLRAANLVLLEEEQRRQISLRTAVHDLKTPLGSISGFAELIADEKGTNSSVQEFSDTIRRISRDSLELVDSVLNSSPSPAEDLAPTNLISLIEEACRFMSVHASAKGQSIVTELFSEEAYVCANPIQLKELLANILSNAVKFSPNTSSLFVRCYPRKGKYLVAVEDQGGGFTEEDKALAFRLGQKLSTRPTAHEGSTGIGLFIAKKIAEHHQGSLFIGEPRSGKGGCVIFEIPALRNVKQKCGGCP
jgi:signal transduction histidine kinase